MSVEAITWALKQPIKQSSAKFVLVVLANCASGETFLAYPSTKYLCGATGQDRKTVMANLAKLREWGMVEDTGRRTGLTKQIVVYRIRCDASLFCEGVQKRNSPENGTVPKTPGNGPVFPSKESQKRDTEPSGTVTKQNLKADAPSAKRGCRLPADWRPTDGLISWALERPGMTPAALGEEIDKFTDHWKAAPGSKGVKLDWSATFRNWIRNAKPSHGSNNHANPRKLSAVDRVAENVRLGQQRDADGFIEGEAIRLAR